MSREDQAIAKFKRSTMRTATYRPEDDESLLGEDATPVDGFDSHWGHSERKDSRQTWNMPPGISGHEWATARLAPDCIVADLLFADVGVLIAPGGHRQNDPGIAAGRVRGAGQGLYRATCRAPRTGIDPDKRRFPRNACCATAARCRDFGVIAF